MVNDRLKLNDQRLVLIDHLPRKHFKSIGTEMGSECLSFCSILNMNNNKYKLFYFEVSSIAMNNQDKEVFLVGCDSGGLFKCSLASQKKVSTS